MSAHLLTGTSASLRPPADWHFFSTCAIVIAWPGRYAVYMQQKQVILYGDSLILAGVQASLGAFPDLEVITLDPALEKAEASLRGLHPAAVIFDRSSTMDIPMALMRQPGLLLISVDVSSDEMEILSGSSRRALSATDLANVISQADNPSEITPEEKHAANGQPA
jgi:hypothetical protein